MEDAVDRNRSNAAPAGVFPDVLLAPEAILEGLPDAVVAATEDGRIVFVNALAEQLFGYQRAELLGRGVEILWPEREHEHYRRNMRLYFATEHPLRFSTEVWGRRRDGSEFVGEMSWGIVSTSSGPVLLAVGRDISERRAAEDRLRAVAAMGERALAGAEPSRLAAEAVQLVRTTLPVSGAQVRLADGQVLAAHGQLGDDPVCLAIGTGDDLCVSLERTLRNSELSVLRAVANTLATALERLRSEERMRHEAIHDPLTGLANRTFLHQSLERALSGPAGDQEHGIAVLFVDLDGFKQVNDLHGHAAGDAVLVETARRLRAAVRPSDTVARYGGDEFVVVCEHVDRSTVLMLGQRLQEALRAPVRDGWVEHRLSASIGIALGARDAACLLAEADRAAYRAKALGRGQTTLA